VSLDKVREKFARLDRLREVSLENANVVKGDPFGSILNTCPSEHLTPPILHPTLIIERSPRTRPFPKPLRRLGDCRSDYPRTACASTIIVKVSHTIVVVRSQAITLPSRNRLQLPTNRDALTNAFLTLTELQLNDTLMTWVDMQVITAFMPQLQAVEMGYNKLTQLGGDKPPSSPNSTILSINLDSNLCSDWIHIWGALKEYES
jgi:hypothetical protein